MRDIDVLMKRDPENVNFRIMSLMLFNCYTLITDQIANEVSE